MASWWIILVSLLTTCRLDETCKLPKHKIFLVPLRCDEIVFEDSKFEVLTASVNNNCHSLESVCLGRLHISVSELAVQMIVKETSLHHGPFNDNLN